MREIWKPIKTSNYEVSSVGRVRRSTLGSRTFVGKLLKLGHNSKGYVTVQLLIDGKNMKIFVHKLVAEAFIGPRPTWLVMNGDELVEVRAEINHKDLNKENNYWKNLEYLEGLENIKHAVKNGAKFGASGHDQHGERNPSAKLTWKKVRKIRRMYATGKYNQRELGELVGMPQGSLWYIISNKTWKESRA